MTDRTNSRVLQLRQAIGAAQTAAARVKGRIGQAINLHIVHCDDGVDCSDRERRYWQDVKSMFGL